MLQEKRMCLAHLFNQQLSRAWRSWADRVLEAELMARALARMRNVQVVRLRLTLTLTLP